MKKSVLRILLAMMLMFILIYLVHTVYSHVSSEEVTLWVVTEKTTSSGMNQAVREQTELFEEAHQNVTIHIDILPTSEPERSAYIQDLIAKISSGSGPDIFLLPTDNLLILDEPKAYTYLDVESLFPDVSAAMRKGYFADIRKWLNQDPHISASHFCKKVLDAGNIGKETYILPLFFDLPTVYIFPDMLEENELAQDFSDYTIVDWMQYGIKSQSATLAAGLEYTAFEGLAPPIDYASVSILLTRSELTEYLCLFQQLEECIGEEYLHRQTANPQNVSILAETYPIRVDTLNSSLAYMAYAQRTDQELIIYPLKNSAGEVAAIVQYYAAIGASCQYPEIAYAYITTFLSESVQHNIHNLQNSFPIRTDGAAIALWTQQINQQPGYNPYKSTIPQDPTYNLTNKIEATYFPIEIHFEEVLSSLNSGNDSQKAEPIDPIVDTLISTLEHWIASNLRY